MAQDPTSKEAGFVQRYAGAVSRLWDNMLALADLKTEWDSNGYATGAATVEGTNFNIGDTVVQSILPGANAAMLNAAVGAVESIRTTFAANEGYLTCLRP